MTNAHTASSLQARKLILLLNISPCAGHVRFEGEISTISGTSGGFLRADRKQRKGALFLSMIGEIPFWGHPVARAHEPEIDVSAALTIRMPLCHATSATLCWSLLAAAHRRLRLRAGTVPQRPGLGISAAQSPISACLPVEPTWLRPHSSPKKWALSDAHPSPHPALHCMGPPPLSLIRRCRLPRLRSVGYRPQRARSSRRYRIARWAHPRTFSPSRISVQPSTSSSGQPANKMSFCAIPVRH
jgi:hypothetical protein